MCAMEGIDASKSTSQVRLAYIASSIQPLSTSKQSRLRLYYATSCKQHFKELSKPLNEEKEGMAFGEEYQKAVQGYYF